MYPQFSFFLAVFMAVELLGMSFVFELCVLFIIPHHHPHNKLPVELFFEFLKLRVTFFSFCVVNKYHFPPVSCHLLWPWRASAGLAFGGECSFHSILLNWYFLLQGFQLAVCLCEEHFHQISFHFLSLWYAGFIWVLRRDAFYSFPGPAGHHQLLGVTS